MPLTYRGPLLLVFTLSQLTGRLLGGHLAGSGLSASEFAVYSLILAEGRLTPRRLADVLGMPPTTVSSVVRQMQARDHVSRVRNPNDGRSVLLELTPKGRRVTQRASRGFAAALTAFQANLDIPESRLLAALEAMVAALEAALEAAAADRTDAAAG